MAAVEADHWWYKSMRETTAALLGPYLTGHQSLLDAGCGAGGFLEWAASTGHFDRLAGCDVAGEAIAMARKRTTGFDLRIAPLHRLPFAAGAFDVVTVNHVLQHVHEEQVLDALQECRRRPLPGASCCCAPTVLAARTGSGRIGASTTGAR